MSGGGNNKASDQARRDEQERLAKITETQSAINRVFDDPSRAADIADAAGGVRDFYTRDLDEKKALNDRQLTFALARNGQVGGSTQLDRQAQLGRDYSKGLLEVDSRARGFGAELESADQDARARLISLATSGPDSQTAASQSAAAMRSSLQAGKSAATLGGLSDVFGQFGQFYKDSRENAVRRRADQQAFGLYGGRG